MEAALSRRRQDTEDDMERLVELFERSGSFGFSRARIRKVRPIHPQFYIIDELIIELVAFKDTLRLFEGIFTKS